MKINSILEEKTLSAVKLAKASGKIEVGLNETKRALDTGKLKMLLIASDIEKKQRMDVFKLPEKNSFSREEVHSILKRYESFLKHKKKKKVINIKKELALTKIIAEERGITVLEGLSKKRLGKAVGILMGTSCIAILDLGRAKNIFASIIEENR